MLATNESNATHSVTNNSDKRFRLSYNGKTIKLMPEQTIYLDVNQFRHHALAVKLLPTTHGSYYTDPARQGVLIEREPLIIVRELNK